jgi:hypothetical protein
MGKTVFSSFEGKSNFLASKCFSLTFLLENIFFASFDQANFALLFAVHSHLCFFRGLDSASLMVSYIFGDLFYYP